MGMKYVIMWKAFCSVALHASVVHEGLTLKALCQHLKQDMYPGLTLRPCCWDLVNLSW